MTTSKFVSIPLTPKNYRITQGLGNIVSQLAYELDADVDGFEIGPELVKMGRELVDEARSKLSGNPRLICKDFFDVDLRLDSFFTVPIVHKENS